MQLPPSLTRKEREVVELAVQGMSQRAIGLALGISRSAVRDRLESAGRKLAAAHEAEPTQVPEDDHHLLERFRRRYELRAAQAKVLAAEAEHANGNGRPPPGSLPGDPRALRGIPAIGGPGSLGGAIHGTRPEVDALENLDRRRPGAARTEPRKRKRPEGRSRANEYPAIAVLDG